MGSGNIRFRRLLVTGLLATGPLAVTAYMLWIVFAWLDGILQPLFMRFLHFHIPGLGFVALLVLVLLTGLFASHFVGERIVRGMSARLERLPLWSPVYRAVREVSEVLLSERSASFRRVAALEYPRKDLYVLVFVTSEGPSPLDAKLGCSMVNVFLPSTPNPTTGFFIMVPREQLLYLDLTVEQAVKLILSGGAMLAGRDGLQKHLPEMSPGPGV